MIAKALTIQYRVISALIFRELKTRFGQSRLGIFWLFFEPVTHLVILMMIWSILRDLEINGVNSILFLASGIIPFLAYRNMAMQIFNSVRANKTLLIFPQVRLMDLLIARLSIEITVYVGSFFAIFFTLWLFGYPVRIENFNHLLLGSLALCSLGLATGIFFIPIVALFPALQHVMKIMLRVLYFVSGVMYSIEIVPAEYQRYMLYNPLVHVIYYIRQSMFVEIPAKGQYMDMSYVLFFSAICFLIGYYLTGYYKKEVLESK